MEKYIKPCIAAQTNIKGAFPLAVVAGLSAAELAGVAAAAGVAVGLASNHGSDDVISYRAKLILQA